MLSPTRGEWQQVLCLLNEMQIAKIALNTRTVNEVMASFAKADGPKEERLGVLAFGEVDGLQSN